jgi:serine/threonine protein kinase
MVRKSSALLLLEIIPCFDGYSCLNSIPNKGSRLLLKSRLKCSVVSQVSLSGFFPAFLKTKFMLSPDTVLQSRYRIVRQLGQGGMGTVYEAIDMRFDNQVALKETHFTEEALRKQFEREARLLNRLRHPAIARVIDHFPEGEGQFLVMDYVEGEDLWEKLEQKGGAFPVEDVVKWADQLLDALEYLHSQDPPIIHRDIKPQNLKLTSRNQIILLDFGLAKGFAGQISRVTTSGSIFGYTPNYAPLEQIHGTGTDARSDLYSLAATLYHLLTGISPPDALSRAMALTSERPDPLRPANEVNSLVPSAIADVLQRAMVTNPAKRPDTAAAMREMLRAANQRPTPATSQLKETLLAPALVTTTPTKEAEEQNTQPLHPNHTQAFDGQQLVEAAPLDSALTVMSPQATLSGSYSEHEYATEVTQPHYLPFEQPIKKSKRLPLIIGSIVLLAVGITFALVYFLSAERSSPAQTEQSSLTKTEPSSSAQTDIYETVSSEELKREAPDPLLLVIRVSKEGSVLLNGQRLGTLDDTKILESKLSEVFGHRRQYNIYRAGTTELDTTVWILTSDFLNGSRLQTLAQAVKASGAKPIKTIDEQQYFKVNPQQDSVRE